MGDFEKELDLILDVLSARLGKEDDPSREMPSCTLSTSHPPHDDTLHPTMPDTLSPLHACNVRRRS